MIERQIEVRIAPEAAFRVWTERIHLWWPPGHRRSGDPRSHVVLEAGEGGRFFERTEDGRELDFGRVQTWEPPDRLELAFYLGGGAERPSHVAITFLPCPAGTRVQVRHTAGALGSDFDRIAVRFRANWPDVLSAFAAHSGARP